MIPQTIPDGAWWAACDQMVDLGEKWKLDPGLVNMLWKMAQVLPFPIQIISGYRTADQQNDEIMKPDTTAAPVWLSNHTICPARAADLNPVVPVVSISVKLTIGRAADLVGLRWGGGAPRDSEGIPEGREWRHVDLGPRPR